MSDSIAGAPSGSLDRGLAILDQLATMREATVPQLAEATGMTRSTTYRLVARLSTSRHLESAYEEGKWRLGPAVARMAMAAVQSTDVIHAAPEVMRLLVEQTRETAGLGVYSQGQMVFVFRERGPQAMTVSAEPGAQRPLHCTAVGKAYLAALPTAEGASLLSSLELKAYTPRTITSRKQVSNQLNEIRERGWSEDYQEYEPASICCGAAIRDHTGRPVAAISVSGLAERVRPQVGRFGPVVASTADAISRKLGYVPEILRQ